MYSTESINNFSQPQEFLNLTDPAERARLQAECAKLKYLNTYPTVVRSRIREKQNQITSMELELSLDINSKSSEMQKIIRRQDLQPSYSFLKKLREELVAMKEELVYAQQVKAIASVKLGIYEQLLSDFERGGQVSVEGRNKKQFRLNKLFRPTRYHYGQVL